MDWKGIKEKVVVAVIAGIILAGGGWLLNRLLTPDDQPVRAAIEWLDFANPGFRKDLAATQDLDKALTSYFGISGLADAAYNLAFQSNFRVGAIKFSNSTNARTREIEVSLEGAVLFSGAAVSQPKNIQSSLTLKPLDPRSSATVYFVGRRWWIDDPVKAIHDNRSIEVTNKILPEHLPFYSNAVVRYPFVVIIFFVIGVLIVGVFLFAASFDFFVTDKLKFQAKNTSKDQVKKKIEFIEYVRTNFPEKIPSTEDVGGTDASANVKQ
jgi:hypothetical protein